MFNRLNLATAAPAMEPLPLSPIETIQKLTEAQEVLRATVADLQERALSQQEIAEAVVKAFSDIAIALSHESADERYQLAAVARDRLRTKLLPHLV